MKRALITVIALLLTLLSLTACQNKKNTVTLIFISDDAVYATVTLDSSNTAVLPDTPLKLGYTFGGWYYDQAFTQRFSTNDGFSRDTTLYAKWTKNVIDDDEGGGGNTNTALFTYALNKNGTYTVTGYSGDDEIIIVPISYKSVSVEIIADKAFFNNKKVKTVSLTKFITEVGENAFGGCDNLSTIKIDSNNPYYMCEDGNLYNKERTVIVRICPKTSVKEYKIYSNITRIAPYAFDGCVNSVSFVPMGAYSRLYGYVFYNFNGKITLNNTVSEIANRAFYEAKCEVSFAEDYNMTTVNVGAFDHYYGEKLVLPKVVTTIGGFAFSYSTATVDLSVASVKSLNENSFADYYGKELVVPKEVSTIGKNAFYRSQTDVTFESGSVYDTVYETVFNQFSGTVKLPPSVTTIQKDAFWNAKPVKVEGVSKIMLYLCEGSTVNTDGIGIGKEFISYYQN